MNYEVFTLINGAAGNIYLLDIIMKACTEYVPIVFILILMGMYGMGVFYKNSHLRQQAFATGVYVILSLFITLCIGRVYYENRPFVDHKVNMLLPHVPDAGFPSDHAVGTMSIAMGILYSSPWVGRLLFILSILVGVSRIYVGHHYPMDVLGGFIIVWCTSIVYHRYLGTMVMIAYQRIERFVLTKCRYHLG